jgi:hypothetical protein
MDLLEDKKNVLTAGDWEVELFLNGRLIGHRLAGVIVPSKRDVDDSPPHGLTMRLRCACIAAPTPEDEEAASRHFYITKRICLCRIPMVGSTPLLEATGGGGSSSASPIVRVLATPVKHAQGIFRAFLL